MAKKQKMWTVPAEYAGTVSLETQGNRVVLSNSLSQDVLAELARSSGAGFIKQTTKTVLTNEG